MVGRYLNAARIGQEVLDESLARGDTEVPTFDYDASNTNWDCSKQGYCLYPHTKISIEELARVYLLEGDRLKFTPRLVLQKILDPLINKLQLSGEGLELEKAFSEVIPNSDVVFESRNQGAERPDRLSIFVKIWGADPDTLGEAKGAIPEVVYRELGFSDLDNVVAVKPTAPPVAELVEVAPGKKEFAKKERDQVITWLHESKRLDSSVANTIREFLSNSFTMRILSGYHFGAEAMKVGTGEVNVPNAVGNNNKAVLTFLSRVSCSQG